MNISDFDYPLPDERIAKFPLSERDSSKLLVYRNGNISETVFGNIGAVLTPDSLLIFNNTRVVRARILMRKPSGARVEVLCLEPRAPADYERAFAARRRCEWSCMVGNSKKWKSGALEIPFEHNGKEYKLQARRDNSEGFNPRRKEKSSVSLTSLRSFSSSSLGIARVNTALPSFVRRLPSEFPSRGGVARSAGVVITDGQQIVYPTPGFSPTGEQIVRFEWDADLTFGQLLEHLGRMPIPPYLGRDSEEIDNTRYQTVYSRIEGSVAAPTAGLHFTPELIDWLKNPSVIPSEEQSHDEESVRGHIEFDEVTLHVGAGTFLPVKSENVLDHPMHTEHFEVTLATVEHLLAKYGKIIAVGTTSVRTLESLVALAWRIAQKTCHPASTPHCGHHSTGGEFPNIFEVPVGQFELYDIPAEFDGRTALEALVRHMKTNCLQKIKASTQIMITPGLHERRFRFRIVDGMITNFHQPKSTLLLLVSAFTGGADEKAADYIPTEWRKIYDYAISHDFRFLSYGDSSLLLR